MAMPVPDKSWQFYLGPWFISSNNKVLLYELKALMVGFATNPWVVTGSSDSVTAGMDAVDRWTDSTKIVNATGAHSWIVLQQTGLAANFELCIDCRFTDTWNLQVLWATSGFSGGSTTARPTASGEVTLYTSSGTTNNFSWKTVATNTVHFKLFGWQSTDGQCTRIVAYQETGIPVFWFFADRIKNPLAGHTDPFYVSGFRGENSPTTSKMTIARFTDSDRLQSRQSSTVLTAYLSGEGAIAGLLAEYTAWDKRNDINNQIMVCPIGVVSGTTGGRGHLGQVYDMWWGPRNVVYGGLGDATWPNDGSRKYWEVGEILLPWDGLNTSPSPGTFPQILAT